MAHLYLRDYPKAETYFRTVIKLKTDEGTPTSTCLISTGGYKEKVHLADDILLEGLRVLPEDIGLHKSGGVLPRREEYNCRQNLL